jgi:hypothetical protein
MLTKVRESNKEEKRRIMTLNHLLNAEWFGWLVIIFLAVTALKNVYQLGLFLIHEFISSA